MDEVVQAKVIPWNIPKIMRNKGNGLLIWFLGRRFGVVVQEFYNEDGDLEYEVGHYSDEWVPLDDTTVWEPFNGGVILRNEGVSALRIEEEEDDGGKNV